MVARANRRGIGLFTLEPWNGTLAGRGAKAERYLRRGLRHADGIAG